MTSIATRLPLLDRSMADPGLLLDGFTRAAIEAGERYARSGRVRDIELTGEGRVVTAKTQGTARRPYRQHIVLRPTRPDGGITVAGTCSCPVGQNCKHVAAVLIAAGPRLSLAPPRRAEEQLSPEIAVWLDQLGGRHEEASEDYPEGVRQRLFYVLGTRSWPRGADTLGVACFAVTLRKNGTPGAPRPYAPYQVATPARYLRPSDRQILRRLSLGHLDSGRCLHADDDPVDLLRRIIATGRGRWGTAEGPELREGAERPGRIAWRVNPDGSQRAMLELEPGLAGFRLAGPWYADPASGTVGPVACGLPAHLAVGLLEAPAIPPDVAPRVAAALAQRLPGIAVPPPVELAPPEIVRGPPVPHLRLATVSLPSLPFHFGGRHAAIPALEAVPVAELSFRYGPVTVPHLARGATAAAPDPVVAQDGRLLRVQRERRAEQAAVTRLGGIGFAPAALLSRGGQARAQFLLTSGDDTDWLGVMLDEMPALRRLGWEVEVDDDFPIRLVEAEGPPEVELREGSGIDWLELHLGVTVGGQRVDLVPALLPLIAAGELASLAGTADDDDAAPIPVPLPDGRLLVLPAAQLQPILHALAELFAGGGLDPEARRIRFTRLDAADLAGLEERSGIVWRGGEAVRSLGRQLREAGGAIPPVSVPTDFRGTLRPYQAQGVAWLQFLCGAGLGGVLADDMGLGKTVQTLAHLAIEQAAGRLDRPSLVVCPTSLVPNWRQEAERFAPDLKLLALHGPDRKARFGEIGAHELVLTTYPLLTRDHGVLTAQDWHVVVLDEAQSIKNPNAETTRQALRLQARQRLCLSGTPLQNHLGELWSLFDFLAPGFLGDARSFRNRYRTPIEKRGDAARQAGLNRRVRPFLLRRTKDEVVRELPPKTEIAEPVEMEAGQRAIYDSIRMAMHVRVRAAIAEKGLARSGIIILDALLKMRQACCDPRLLKLKAAKEAKAGSAKLERLAEMLDTMLAEGRRVLVFSQFTSMLALIADRLGAAGIKFELLTGDTVDRAAPVRRFQAGAVPVFLISLKAGGVGLNLTAADTVIHYDPWWNPAVEDQATDRAHRIGQTRAVFVHRLITLGTIEEKMEVLKERKRALVQAVLQAGEGGALALSEADIEELFA